MATVSIFKKVCDSLRILSGIAGKEVKVDNSQGLLNNSPALCAPPLPKELVT